MENPAARYELPGSIRGRYRTSGQQPVEQGKTRRHVRVRRVLSALVRGRHEVRQRHRLAEFLRSPAGFGRHETGSEIDLDAHRIPLRALWRTSGPRLRRWAEAHRTALLQ